MLSERDAILCELLLLRCRRRDLGAARELTAMFHRPLLYYVRRIVDSESEAIDILQETWLKIFATLDRIRDTRTFPAFAYRTARNFALAHLRKQKTDARLLESYVAEIEACDDASAETFSADDSALVHTGLSQLPLPQREVLTLHFLQDLSIVEIASVVGVPEGTIKSRLFHAKKALRAILQKGDIHEP